MKALQSRVAGIDVHKEILAVTVLIGEADAEPEVTQFQCDTFTEDLMRLGSKLLDLGVKDVVCESTGVYWKPLHNVLTPMGITLTVGQAAHMRNVPGRKTDMNDSHWIATLHRYGLVRASFIPDDVFQRMRLLSRHRTNLVEDLSRVKNRVQRTLEDGNVKFGSIASDVFGKSGIQILRSIAAGNTDAKVLASKVTTQIKRKEEARKALTNCLTKDHCFLVKELMAQYDDITKRIVNVENELMDRAKPYSHLIEELQKIPGISDVLAYAIIAEATTDMSHFKDERSFAAWSGVAPGNNESASKKKDQNVGRGILTYGES